MEHYGYKYNFQAPEIKEQIKQTNLKKYGYEHVFQNPYVQREMRKKYWYKDICFDSSWELAFYIYHEDNNIPIEREPVVISFEIDGKEKHYYPDFKVGNQLIEIKGDMLIDEKGNIKPYPKKVEDLKEKGQFKEIEELFKFCETKTKAIKENNIKVIKNEEIKPYLKYIKDSYGKDYLKQFKVKK